MTGFVGRFCTGGGGEAKKKGGRRKKPWPGGGKYAKAAHAERSPKARGRAGENWERPPVWLLQEQQRWLYCTLHPPVSRPRIQSLSPAVCLFYSHYQTAITAVVEKMLLPQPSLQLVIPATASGISQPITRTT
jgi:hypothetical protein